MYDSIILILAKELSLGRLFLKYELNSYNNLGNFLCEVVLYNFIRDKWKNNDIIA